MFPYEKLAGIVTRVTMAFVICVGLALLFMQLKPFEVDEWRLIYNLKFKDVHALWGQLDFVQQFPRVYLQMVKALTQYFNYSYTSLRLPSFIVGTSAVALSYRLMQRLFPVTNWMRFLFVLIVISSHTFVTYYLQVKQYTMDIFLSLVAVWQLLQLLHLLQTDKVAIGKYVLLLLTLIVAPFFSYTYPIVIAPVFLVVMVQSVSLLKNKAATAGQLVKTALPLIACMASLAVFYTIDAAQVNKDPGMQQYWRYLMMHDGFNVLFFFKGFYLLFAEMGAGLLFEIIFGLLGMGAFIMAVAGYVKQTDEKNNVTAQVKLYCILLVSFTLLLFAIGKLPIGEPRLNSYSVTAIAILIVCLLAQLKETRKGKGIAIGASVVLMLGTVGHIATATIHDVSGKDYKRKIAIYKNTEGAIKQAQASKMPIMITSDVAFPSEKMICYPKSNVVAYTMCWPPTHERSLHFNPMEDMPGDWVLKTLPAYKIASAVPVYAIGPLNNIDDYMQQLPAGTDSVMAGDGLTFRVIAAKR